MDSIYLQGSEQVSNAAQSMRRAADEMNSAANNLAGALEAHQRWMDDWLLRLQQIMEAHNATQ